MLVLSRKLEERIQIGENVTITILKIRGNSVQIGIEAPRAVSVVRGELPARRPEQEVCEPEADFAQAPGKSDRLAPPRLDPRSNPELEPHRQAQRVAKQRAGNQRQASSAGQQPGVQQYPLHVGQPRIVLQPVGQESGNQQHRNPQQLGAWNPGERKPSGGASPLAEHLHARRVPSVCTATLSG